MVVFNVYLLVHVNLPNDNMKMNALLRCFPLKVTWINQMNLVFVVVIIINTFPYQPLSFSSMYKTIRLNLRHFPHITWYCSFCILFLELLAMVVIISHRGKIRGPLCQKQISRIRTRNYIPQKLWYVITCPCFWRNNPDTVKPVYNDHLMGYFSAFWSSSRWPKAT